MRPVSTGCSRVNPGPPNFRARCVSTCQGHRPRRTPATLAILLGRMLPSASCQRVGVLKFGVFRGSISWPVVPPVNASCLALRPCPHDSEPVWLATPSPYGSCIRYIMPAVMRLHHVLQSGCCYVEEHDAYASGWRYDTSSPIGSRLGTSQVHLLTLLFSVRRQNGGSGWNHHLLSRRYALRLRNRCRFDPVMGCRCGV